MSEARLRVEPPACGVCGKAHVRLYPLTTWVAGKLKNVRVCLACVGPAYPDDEPRAA